MTIKIKPSFLLALSTSFGVQAAFAAQSPVPMGSTADFAILAGTEVTATASPPTTTINGDVGVSTGTLVTGDPVVNGTYHLGDQVAANAQSDLTIAYNNAAGRDDTGATTVAGNIGGNTLFPGLYFSTSSLAISSGNLTLDAQNDSNAVWIFQIASTLTTTANIDVFLANGAQADNVFWQVGSSATLGTASSFKGNILAYANISLNVGAVVEGRLLAETGAVSLAGNTVSNDLPLPPSFGPTIRASDGAVTLVITNSPGFAVTLQISSDLVNWTNLTTITPNATPYTYTDTTPSGQAQRYYRALTVRPE